MGASQTARRITKRVADSLRATGRDYIVFDSALPGFGIRVKPSGLRTYVVQYRVPGAGRRSSPRRITLGNCATLTPDEARGLARKTLGSVHHGKDPARERAERREAPLVSDIAPLFLAAMDREKKPSTAYQYRQMFGYTKEETGAIVPRTDDGGDILPAIGKLRVRDVARYDVAKLRDRKEARYAANRVVALVSAFFSWCEERGYREQGTNPCRGIKRHHEEPRRRYLSPDEARALGRALRDEEKSGANLFAIAAIRFLLLTGFREQEALSLPWSAIQLSTARVTLPDAKTSERERTLNAPTLTLLDELPRVAGNPYVFPGFRVGDRLHEVKPVWERVRLAAGLQDFRLHDLRHSFASAAISSGATLAVVGELLGHRYAQTTKRYAHLYDDARRAASDQASTALLSLLNDVETPVTPLRAERTA